MAKKIHCKDGLSHQQEIEARRLRRSLEEEDEVKTAVVRELYKEWYKKPKESFLHWLVLNGHVVMSSALKRMEDWSKVVSDK